MGIFFVDLALFYEWFLRHNYSQTTWGGDFTSINLAINAALPGDTVLVYPGRYEEALIINKNINLIGKGPQNTIIFSSNNGITINNDLITTISGFTITSAKIGIVVNSGTTTLIKNNCIVSNGDRGIYLYGVVYSLPLTISTIINNVIAFNASAGIENASSPNASLSASFFNNIIYNNGNCGIKWVKPFTISHNNLFGNANGNYCSTITQGTGDISMDPLFVNAFSGNFLLQNSSPSKNSGRPGSGDLDPDGSRNDMGAYGGQDAAPFWPYPVGAPIITELTITPQTVNKGQTITINARGEVW